MHAATTLKLLNDNELDFLSGKFSNEEVQTIKKRIIESILFTDMSTMK
jgi:hypothetical protein